MPETGNIKNKVPPHSKSAETSVLGAILLDRSVIALVRVKLAPEDFYIPAHQHIYSAMLNLDDNGRPVDVTTLENELASKNLLQRAGGIDYIVELASQVPTTANAMHYADIVREKSRIRRVIDAANTIISKGYAPDDDKKEEMDFFDWSGSVIYSATQEDRISTYTQINQELEKFFAKWDEISNNPEIAAGIETGYNDLDKLLGGLKSGDLIILAARPSMGKTSLALNMAENIAEKGVPVLIFSLEMNKESLTNRLLASASEVDLQRLKNLKSIGKKIEQDHALVYKLQNGANKLHKCPIFMDDTPAISISNVRARCRQWRSSKEIFPSDKQDRRAVVIVDYLQLMSAVTGKNMNREQEVSNISRGLKALAREIDAPVIVLSQLNREVEKNKDHKPTLANLRESGAIEQDADIIMFVHRPEYFDRDNESLRGKAELIVAKHRNGPTGMVPLHFVSKYAKFENSVREDDPRYSDIPSVSVAEDEDNPFL